MAKNTKTPAELQAEADEQARNEADEAARREPDATEAEVQARQSSDGNHQRIAGLHRTAAALHQLAAEAPADKSLQARATQASEECRGHNHPVPAEEASIEAANGTRAVGISHEARAEANLAAAAAHEASALAHEAV